MTLRSVAIVTLLVFLDQAAKFSASINLQLNESLPVIKNVLHVTMVHNTGVAFGFFKGMLLVFIFLSVVVVFFAALCANRLRSRYTYVRLGLLFIIAGTIGNLIDRIRFGYVIDFIDLRIWPVFNIADLAISAGGALLVYHIIRNRHASHII